MCVSPSNTHERGPPFHYQASPTQSLPKYIKLRPC